jgi:hypothetical protein
MAVYRPYSRNQARQHSADWGVKPASRLLDRVCLGVIDWGNRSRHHW